MIELPEAVPDVGVEHPLGAPVGLDPDGLKGLVGRTPGPKPIACRQEVGLKIGSKTSFAAVIATRSRTHGIDSGLVRPGCPGLGI